MRRRLIGLASAILLGVVLGCNSSSTTNSVELLNVSYDPTRELWRDINRAFQEEASNTFGVRLTVKQSHGASASQARAVIDGLKADVVTLALFSDTDAIRKKGLLAENWQDRLPERSLPYLSTIVFVVRKGNPKDIRDWPDLAKKDLGVITPNPKTSGNGKLSFLAAWGSVLTRGGSETEAEDYIRQLYRNVLVLDTGARGATVSFAQRGLGDVHLTWENEARLEVEEAKGTLEIVYPPVSIRAEPHVAVVDANVERKNTREIAEAYLRFLYTEAGQNLVAKHYYRPTNAGILAKHRERFPELTLFPITAFVKDWDSAQEKFFSDGGVFDRIYSK